MAYTMGLKIRHIICPGRVESASTKSISVVLNYRGERVEVPLKADLWHPNQTNMSIRYHPGDIVYVKGEESAQSSTKITVVCHSKDAIEAEGTITLMTDKNVCDATFRNPRTNCNNKALFNSTSMGPGDDRWAHLLSFDSPEPKRSLNLERVFHKDQKVSLVIMPMIADKYGRTFYAIKISPKSLPKDLPHMCAFIDGAPKSTSNGHAQTPASTSSVPSTPVAPPRTYKHSYDMPLSEYIPRGAGSSLAVDRSNMVVFNGTQRRTSITDERRRNQPMELHDQLFVVVGRVDWTNDNVYHVYSGKINHGILITDDKQLHQLGAWFVASARKIHDPLLDPIIWQVYNCRLLVEDWPRDQWGDFTTTVKLGEVHEIIVKCNAIVTNFSEQHAKLDVFHDLLHRISTGPGSAVAREWRSSLPTGADPDDFMSVEVTARFGMIYNDQSFIIESVTPLDSAKFTPTSNELITSDNFTVTRVSSDYGFARHPIVGEVFFGFPLIQGAHSLQIGDMLRLTIVARYLDNNTIWQCIRLSILTGSPNLKLAVPHQPMNSIDGLSHEQQMQVLHERRGHKQCGKFVRQLLHSQETKENRAMLTSSNLRVDSAASSTDKPPNGQRSRAPSMRSEVSMASSHMSVGYNTRATHTNGSSVMISPIGSPAYIPTSDATLAKLRSLLHSNVEFRAHFAKIDGRLLKEIMGE